MNPANNEVKTIIQVIVGLLLAFYGINFEIMIVDGCPKDDTPFLLNY